MNSDSKEPNKPRIPDAIDMQRLQKMKTVADMKALADKNRVGFLGGYYDEKTGEMFTMDNLPEGFDTSSITDSILPPEE